MILKVIDVVIDTSSHCDADNGISIIILPTFLSVFNRNRFITLVVGMHLDLDYPAEFDMLIHKMGIYQK